MEISKKYKFSAGDEVPKWIYQVYDIPTKELAVTRFGIDGFVMVNEDLVYVWPSGERHPESFVFLTEGFWGNAYSGHERGDSLLNVFSDENSAISAIGEIITESLGLIPDEDPRESK